VAGIGVVAPRRHRRAADGSPADAGPEDAGCGAAGGGVAHDFNNVLATITLSADVLRPGIDDPTSGPGWTGSSRPPVGDGAHPQAALLRPAAADPPRRGGRRRGRATVCWTWCPGRWAATIEVDVDVAGCPPVLVDPTHFEQGAAQPGLSTPATPCRAAAVSRCRPVLAPAGVRLDGTVVPEASVALVVAGHRTGDESGRPGPGPGAVLHHQVRRVGHRAGLSTVHGIVDGAGGRISIYSEPGLGTSVQVELPVADLPALSRGSPRSPLRGAGASGSWWWRTRATCARPS
jgi:hypothetical protein